MGEPEKLSDYRRLAENILMSASSLPTFTISRLFEASPQQVYAAWGPTATES